MIFTVFQVCRDSERWLTASVWHSTQCGVRLERLFSWNSESFTGAHAVPSPRGALVGLSSSNKAPSPPNWNMKHYKLVEYLSNLNVKPPRTNVKSSPHKRKAPPYWRLSGDGSVQMWETTAQHGFGSRKNVSVFFM